MSAPEAAREAADPATDLTRLAEIAHLHPDLRPVVAANPSIYPDLRAWLAELNDPAVDAALAGGAPVAPPAPLPASSTPPGLAPATPGVAPTTPGLDIVALILAFFAPIVGFILAIVGVRQGRQRPGGPSTVAKAAVWLSVVMFALGTTGIVLTVVAVQNAARDARNAPFCAASKSYPELFADDGPKSLYEPMWTSGTVDPEQYFYTNIDRIEYWHQQWVQLMAYAPSEEHESYLNHSLQQQAELLDTSTGYAGSDEFGFNTKSWYTVSLNVDEVERWIETNCR